MSLLLGAEYQVLKDRRCHKRDEPSPAPDTTKPTIKLTSYVGSKGLSAAHVYIVGIHSGCLPKSALQISDVEVAQFVVALTQTRKLCHLISNRWMVSPVLDGKRVPRFESSPFVDWISESLYGASNR